MNRIRTVILLLSLLAPILAQAQSVDFNFQSLGESFCTPARVQFHNMVSGTPQGFVWIFGNFGSSNLSNPVFTFNSPGTFQVKMIAIYKKKAITITKTITIHQGVTPEMAISRKKLCQPGQVEFTINSGTNESFTWNFGDNSAPVYSTATSITHQYSQFGEYIIQLKSVAATGCQGETSDNISIQKPVITGTVDHLSGCLPVSANFQSQIELPPGSMVSQYSWNFGDGYNYNSVNSNVSHTYSASGNFQPSLSITTNDGCNNQFLFSPVAFGTPPTNLIAHPSLTTFCGSAAPAFYAQATNANRYAWDFGNQDTLSVTDTVINHKFQHIGLTTVTVTPYFNDCPGNPVSFQVNVIGVISRFGYHNSCSDKKTFQFTNASEGHQSDITWSIGGNPIASQDYDITHLFPQSGSVPVSLMVSDNITGCSDLSSVTIYTANPILSNPDRSICKGTTTHFLVENNYENPSLTYEWDVLGLQEGPGLTINPQPIIADVHGHFNHNLVVLDNGVHYCKDTISMQNEMLVRGPVLNFSVPTNFCGNIPCIVNNHSYPFIPGDNILSWHWNFGPPIDEANDTAYTPHPFLYNMYWGHNNISLIAKDNQGCSDSLVTSVEVYKVPFLKKIPDVDSLCAGDSTTIIGFHSDPINWSANGILPCTTCDTLLVKPPHTTLYKVNSINQWNCESKDSVQVVVYEPFTAAAAPQYFSVCKGETVTLHISPKDKIISWLPANLVPGGGFSPTIKPEASQSLTAVLADSAGCFSSRAVVQINLKPLPSIEAGPNRVVPFNSSISLSPIYSSNVVSFLWTPPIQLSCSNCAAPVCNVTGLETYTVRVVSDSGCVASDKISVMVECANSNIFVPTAFTPNRDGLNDLLHPISRGINEIDHFIIYNRLGVKMYEASHVSAKDNNWGWDGNYQGIAQPQTSYIYILQAVCDAGETITTKGSFVLLR